MPQGISDAKMQGVEGAPEHSARVRVEIYALCCPDTGKVRYVGKANNSTERLKTHNRDSRRRNTPLYCWLRKLYASGKQPKMVILCETNNNDWQEAERYYIKHYRTQGNALLNLADGGDQPSSTPEQRAANGHRLNNTPGDIKLNSLKRRMSMALRELRNEGKREAHNMIASKLMLAASKRPDLFGIYRKINLLT